MAPWTSEEQGLLEQALKTYPASTEERWDKIAKCLPQRSKKDCMKRYKVIILLTLDFFTKDFCMQKKP